MQAIYMWIRTERCLIELGKEGYMEYESYEYWVELKATREKEAAIRERENYIFKNCLDKCVRFQHKCKGGMGIRCWKKQRFSDY